MAEGLGFLANILTAGALIFGLKLLVGAGIISSSKLSTPIIITIILLFIVWIFKK